MTRGCSKSPPDSLTPSSAAPVPQAGSSEEQSPIRCTSTTKSGAPGALALQSRRGLQLLFVEGTSIVERPESTLLRSGAAVNENVCGVYLSTTCTLRLYIVLGNVSWLTGLGPTVRLVRGIPEDQPFGYLDNRLSIEIRDPAMRQMLRARPPNSNSAWGSRSARVHEDGVGLRRR